LRSVGSKCFRGVSLSAIRPGEATVRPYLGAEQQVRIVPADTVVLITHNRPLRDLHEALRGRHESLAIVGDAKQPRDLLQAIWEGHAASRALGS